MALNTTKKLEYLASKFKLRTQHDPEEAFNFILDQLEMDFSKVFQRSNMRVQSLKMTSPFVIIMLMKLYWVKR